MTQKIVTQYVRGFTSKSRPVWMAAWRHAPRKSRPDIWCLQETHVATQEEADALECEWKRLWGISTTDPTSQLSYWSLGTRQLGGVAILLTPDMARLAQPWPDLQTTPRQIALNVQDNFLLVNIYAPNDRAERELFFVGLDVLQQSSAHVIFAGDFNCVQNPALDRLGQHISRTESHALDTLVDRCHLVDALDFISHPDDILEWEPSTHFTYWAGSAASRIDRFYVSNTWGDRVQWLEATLFPTASDHQQVTLHISLGKCDRHRYFSKVQYPIRCANQESTVAELIEFLTDRGINELSSVLTWDDGVRHVRRGIKIIARRLKQRRTRHIHKLRRRARRPLGTRQAWHEVQTEDQQEAHLSRVGHLLHRTTDQLRTKFKRVSDWERDQRVTAIRKIHGSKFPVGCSIADKFGLEWDPVLGRCHRTVPKSALRTALHHFVTLSADRTVTIAENRALMAVITEAEVVLAILALSRHKAPVTDGSRNDFYKDL